MFDDGLRDFPDGSLVLCSVAHLRPGVWSPEITGGVALEAEAESERLQSDVIRERRLDAVRRLLTYDWLTEVGRA